MASRTHAQRGDNAGKQTSAKPESLHSHESGQPTHLPSVVQRVASGHGSLSPHDVLQLHPVIGNQAVGSLLAGLTGGQADVIQRANGDDVTEEEMDEAYEEFLNNPALGIAYDEEEEEDEDNYELDVDDNGGGQHAYDRHTTRGIWEAQDILTTHPRLVVIFGSMHEFYDALDNMPAEQDAWVHAGGGRYDAEVDGVHYQGTLLGNTMPLLSCYPVDAGSQYRRQDVRWALDHSDTYDEFLDNLGW